MNAIPNKSSATHTPLEEIRQALDCLEVRIAKLADETPQSTLEILELLDDVAVKIEHSEALGAKLSSEKSQWETILAQFKRKQKQFLRKIGGAESLAAARQAQSPPGDHWWWWIDQSIAAQKRKNLRKGLFTILIVIAALSIAGLVYQRFFAPDPKTLAALEIQQNAENYLQSGQYQQGLVEIEDGLALQPGNPTFLVLRGIFQRALNDPIKAQQDFAAALEIFEHEKTFYTQRASYNLMMGAAQSALDDIKQAQKLDPDYAYAYLLEGQAYQMLGLRQKAIAAYETADQVAEKTGNANIQAYARIYLAEILQNPQIMPTFDDTPMEN